MESLLFYRQEWKVAFFTFSEKNRSALDQRGIQGNHKASSGSSGTPAAFGFHELPRR
jgi:hypothetical protein